MYEAVEATTHDEKAVSKTVEATTHDEKSAHHTEDTACHGEMGTNMKLEVEKMWKYDLRSPLENLESILSHVHEFGLVDAGFVTDKAKRPAEVLCDVCCRYNLEVGRNKRPLEVLCDVCRRYNLEVGRNKRPVEVLCDVCPRNNLEVGWNSSTTRAVPTGLDDSLGEIDDLKDNSALEIPTSNLAKELQEIKELIRSNACIVYSIKQLTESSKAAFAREFTANYLRKSVSTIGPSTAPTAEKDSSSQLRNSMQEKIISPTEASDRYHTEASDRYPTEASERYHTEGSDRYPTEASDRYPDTESKNCSSSDSSSSSRTTLL